MLAYLEVATWVGSVVSHATHYYGNININGKSISVNRVLDAKGAAEMNKDERRSGDSRFTWEVGDTTSRFQSEESLVETAIAFVQAEHPEITFLFKGDHCVLDPMPVLIGPEPLKTELNAMVARAEANDYWEGDEEVMEEIFDEWYKIIKPLRYPEAA